MEIKKITFIEKDDVKKEGILDPIYGAIWSHCGYDCKEWYGAAPGNQWDSANPCHCESTQKYSVWT